MTDKQIIIDGVDVSGCQFFEKEDNYCNIMSCDCHNNCYYKQLKRKEQELQEAMDNYVKLDNQRVKEYNELVDKYNNKEQECERLKHDNGYEVGALEKTIDQLKAENDLFRTCHDNEQAKRRKYEQTLTEIKEIAEKHKKDESVWNPYRQLDKILQKISECEENNE